MALLYLSGNLGSEIAISANTSMRFQRITVIIPTHKELRIKKARYKISGGTFFRLVVQSHPDLDVWKSTSDGNDESPNYLLYKNINSNPTTIEISICIYNTDTISHIAYGESGWSVVLSIE